MESGKKVLKVKAKIDFSIWNFEQYLSDLEESEFEYFQDIFANKEEIYDFKYTGVYWKIINTNDERNGMLFDVKELIFIEE